jgi:hypothetical protein
MRTTASRIITSGFLALGLLASGFTAHAATISMDPSNQSVVVGGAFYVDILATGLPSDTAGGALDISWIGDVTLDSVWLATTDPATDGDVSFPGNWDPVSSFFTGCDSGCSPGDPSISGLYVGSLFGVSGDQAIARLNFTLNSGPSAAINMAAAAIGGTWSSYTSGNFTNTYNGATINAINTVPAPAAVWLFGSGLVGLAGLARRRG